MQFNDLKLDSRQLAICAVFGAAAFAVRAANLIIPIGGPYVLDARGIFVAVGAAFSGPTGGTVIGILAGMPASIPLCDIPSFALVGFLVGLLVPKIGWPAGFGVVAGYPVAAAIISAIFLPKNPSFTFLYSFTALLPRLVVAVPVEMAILFIVMKRFPTKRRLIVDEEDTPQIS